jgi:HEAT repeat protein
VRTLFLIIILSAALSFIPFAEARPVMQHLITGSFEQQLAAIYYFGYSGNRKAFWYFVKNLNREFHGEADRSWGMRFRRAAAVSLGRLKDERGVPFLVKRYKKEKNPVVRRAILFSLSFYGRGAGVTDIIKNGLESKNRELVIEAVATAAVTGDKELVPFVKKIQSGSSDPEVKLVTAYALVKLGGEFGEQIKSIISMLKNPRPELRFLAAYYLSRTEYIGAVDDVIKAIEIEIYSWVRREMEACMYRLNMIRRELKEKEEPF